MNFTNQKTQRRLDSVKRAAINTLGSTIVVLSALISLAVNFFEVRDFYNSTVPVTGTVEQVEEAPDGYFIKISYDYDGKSFTDVNFYESKKDYTEGEQKEIRVLSDNPDLIYTKNSDVNQLYLSIGMFIISSCALISSIVHYVKEKKNSQK